MYENAENFSEVVPAFIAIILAIAGYRRSRISRVLLWTAVGLTALDVALIGVMWSYGWVFAENRVLVALPPLLVPLVFAIRQKNGIVPRQTVAIGALFSFYVVFVARPVAPYWPIALILDAILAALAGLLWLRQRRGPSTGRRFGVHAGGVVVVVAGLVFGVLSYRQHTSVLPASYDMGGMGMTGGISVPQLTGDVGGTPDDVFTLTARPAKVRLDSGKVVDAWTYNGQVPGPQLTVHQGDLVQVTLVNRIPGIGVAIHWHGLDVPNAEDGVPGVTQNAVWTGQSFTYRFRVHQVGTFWYHSHQDANVEVDKGLYGAFVILPKQERAQPPDDYTVLAHDWSALGGAATLNDADGIERHTVAPGTSVRLRLIDTSSESSGESKPAELGVTGTAFRVASIDGNDLNRPTDLPGGTLLPIGSGGRDDVTFTMPDHPVRLTDLVNPAVGLVFSPNGTGTPAAPDPAGPVFDPAHYGSPAPTPFTANSHFDREYTVTLDDRPGFYDGKFYFLPTIDGQTFPNTPMLMVREGDLVEVTLIDRGHADHPMHLHGHTALVLSKDGAPVTGSPWWTDTLDIEPGQSYQIAFRADNPGIWMDHCHNLAHAAEGMIMHLVYEGVSTPYRVGSATGNSPE